MPRIDHAKADRWRAIIDAQRTSGLTVRAFCRERDLREHSFHAWRRKLRKRDADALPAQVVRPPVFAEVRLDEREAGERLPLATPTPLLTLELPGGITARFPLDVHGDTLTNVIVAARRALAC